MSDNLLMQVHSRPTEEQINNGEPASADSLEYLPWGTRSLKVKVSGSFGDAAYIRPQAFTLKASPVAGYADGRPPGDPILVSWGGGWEEGFHLEGKKKKGEEGYIYFNITHRGGEAAESYPLTLEAYHSKRHTKLAELKITLRRPLELPAAPLRPQWRSLPGGDQELIIAPSQSDQVPLYLSRWWPTEIIQYTSTQVEKLPQVRLLCRRNVGKGYSKVEVYAAPAAGEEEKLLAFIDGDIHFPLVDLRQINADLYFISGHWALRVWFAWLETNLEGKVNKDGLGEAEHAVLDSWYTHEIPDAERMDIVFDPQLKLRFLCTDLHWRELWGRFRKKPPLHASIAADDRGKVLLRGASGWFSVEIARLKPNAPQPDQAFDPSLEVKRELHPKEEVGAEKGEGKLHHKHTPFFKGTGFDLDLISDEVLKG